MSRVKFPYSKSGIYHNFTAKSTLFQVNTILTSHNTATSEIQDKFYCSDRDFLK